MKNEDMLILQIYENQTNDSIENLSNELEYMTKLDDKIDPLMKKQYINIIEEKKYLLKKIRIAIQKIEKDIPLNQVEKNILNYAKKYK